VFVFDTPRQWFALAFAVVACGYALWKGGRPERIGAAGMFIAWVGHPFAVDTTDWFAPQFAAAAADAPLLALLLWLALSSDRWWPMWAVAFHFLAIVMSVIIAADPRVQPLAYMTAAVLWNYLTLVTVVVGAATEARRGRA
jgi:hypothetical protein